MSKLAEKLQAAGLKFHIDGSSLMGGVEFEDGRTHRFLMDADVDANGFEENDLVVPVLKTDSAEVVGNLARLATTWKKGGIVWDGETACIKVEIPTSLEGSKIVETIMRTCVAADELEKKLTDGDDDL